MRVSFTVAVLFRFIDIDVYVRLTGPSTLVCVFRGMTRSPRENRRSRGCRHSRGWRLQFANRVRLARDRSAGAWYREARADCSPPIARPVRGHGQATFPEERFR